MKPHKMIQEKDGAKKKNQTNGRRRRSRRNSRQAVSPNQQKQTTSSMGAPQSSLTSGSSAKAPNPGPDQPQQAQPTPQQQNGPTQSTQAYPDASDDNYLLLLKPEFSAMTRITDHLFLTGVGGMTRSNFRRNHIDFVVNITTEAPFWEDIESMRVPLEDDPNANILPYLDTAVDRINEAIVQRNSHVLVHCVAGVSRSATIVIAYLMKHRRMSLRDAFNYCYNMRPVIRPNNGFMLQLINYEIQLFGSNSVYMVDASVDGLVIHIPHFFIEDHPRLVMLEVLRVKEQQRLASIAAKSVAAEEKNKNPKPKAPDD